MVEWIKNKLWDLNDVFEEYPKVFWLFMFYLAIALTAMIGYMPILVKLANFNLMGGYPFYPVIAENIDMLKWGIPIIPSVILLWAWADVAEFYYTLKSKKYRY
ncbi:hypothetical protein LVY74_16745 [Acinetobacter sp. ME22]|uniref:hypothetical protein n=1 Tax=Acinetobacter sp. ME22 TaxID=2904802 RepID=UPI001EDB405F|nr:hypothetical protein [Acinetobacter sp. ME22]MCG2575186.1 hypothetical protein [Acinetobacter sp. ME22]